MGALPSPLCSWDRLQHPSLDPKRDKAVKKKKKKIIYYTAKESTNTFSTDLIILQAGINIKCNLSTQKITSRYISVVLECPRSHRFSHPRWLLSQHFYSHPSVRGSAACRCLTLSRCVSLSGPPLSLVSDCSKSLATNVTWPAAVWVCVWTLVFLSHSWTAVLVPPPPDQLFFYSHCHFVSLACVMDP